MVRKKCRVCGIKLTKSNKYKSKHSHSRGKICIECYNKKKRIKYRSLSKKYFVNMREEYIYNPIDSIFEKHSCNKKIEFDSIKSRREFLTARRIQARWSKCHSESPPRAGKIVSVLVQYMDRDSGTYRQYYINATCSECGAIIKYDNRGYKTCSNCGLIQSSDNIIQIDEHDSKGIDWEIAKRLDTLPSVSYGKYNELEDEDSYSTYDKIFSAMRSKQSKGVAYGLPVRSKCRM